MEMTGLRARPSTVSFSQPRPFILALLLLAVVLLFATKPLLALYHQGQAGRALAQVVVVGDNEYGGFTCLRPFVEDLGKRESLKTALVHLRLAESYAPRQAHTHYLLGRTFCLLGDYESAIPAFQKFTELRPKNPLGSLELGFALLQACPPNGKCADGLNTYDAWRKAGVRAEDFLAMAETARNKEDWETALLWYQNAQHMGMELRSTVANLRCFLMPNHPTYCLLASRLNRNRPAQWEEGFTAQQLIAAGEKAQLGGRQKEAFQFYLGGGVKGKIDGFDGLMAFFPVIIESFVTVSAWLPCHWCENTDGQFETNDGILEMSYRNTPEREGFAFLVRPNTHISHFSELLLRLNGDPSTVLTMEIVVDGKRSRPLNYQPVPSDWEVWSIPLEGETLEEILIGIGEPKPLSVPEEYRLFIDWIALR